MKARVLVVDDSLTVRMDLEEALVAAQLETELAASLAEARSHLARGLPEVLILDVLLPDGDGIDLLREVRARPGGAQVVVLMLSSEVEVADRMRGLTTGADEYVGKPYDRNYVVTKTRALLQQRRAAAGAPAGDVLVIDDSATFRAALCAELEQAGYRVRGASSGEEGLTLAAIERPAAIVVDGVMPGIDGATVVRRLRLDPALRDTPCLVLTASEDRGAELSALDAGADAFVRKDADLALVLAKLAAALRGTSHQVSSARVATQSLAAPKKILAVDDSPTYLNGIADALRREGYDVVLATSGEMALELLAVQKVDCILLDLLMPGIDGTETCRRIKATPTLRDVPVVLLTAREDRDAMVDGLGAGADDYIGKSSEFVVLEARVRAQLRRRESEDENRRIGQELLEQQLIATEARAARELAETRAALAGELERKNHELEAFSYSVSHDLRAPLRAIEGFSRALEEDAADVLDEVGKDHLRRIVSAARRMDELIEGLLELARLGRTGLARTHVDVSALAEAVVAELSAESAERTVSVIIEPGLVADADPRLLRSLLANLLGNAWKFTARTPDPRIELVRSERDGAPAFLVRDNGGGFDMNFVDRLFQPFQRLHKSADFPGTGIGLTTVRRIVERHHGTVWAESRPGAGATFGFTLRPPPG